MQDRESLIETFKSFSKIVFELVKTLALGLLIFVLIRNFLLQPFIVYGSSMEPSFVDREYLLVEKISYKFKKPKRGDVIIFHPPGQSGRMVFYIKRVVGLPGEKIIINNGRVYIYNRAYPNGIELEEPYLLGKKRTTGSLSKTLKQDEYFVLGDNRENSQDSREFGVLPAKNIAGRAFITIFPFSRFGIVHSVDYPNLLTLLLLPRRLPAQS